MSRVAASRRTPNGRIRRHTPAAADRAPPRWFLNRRPPAAPRLSLGRLGFIVMGVRTMRASNLHLEINRANWIIIVCLTNGLSIALALTIAMALTRR
jgi:hypothetical protein